MIDLLAWIVGVGVIVLALWDAFHTVIMPRRITGRFHLVGFFYRFLWPMWRSLANRMGRDKHESMLSAYSPLALLLEIALWAAGLILGFGLLQWAQDGLEDPTGGGFMNSSFYFSGVTFLTLGFGDVYPTTGVARGLAVLEAGIGFAFLALVIGYIPMLYQSFSRRELLITLLDARAGSPPSAGQLLRRSGPDAPGLAAMLADCEIWAAELLESHLSYPALGFFRSQHQQQSWIATLTVILDTCALLLAWTDNGPTRQAQLTFAMARHAAVDLVQVLDVKPKSPPRPRLSPAMQRHLRQDLTAAGFVLRDARSADKRLAELRAMYEPYVHSLSLFLHMPLPEWNPQAVGQDAWEASPYDDVHWYRSTVVQSGRRASRGFGGPS